MRRWKLGCHILDHERACVAWLRQQRGIDVVHFQSLFWLAAPLMRSYRRLGVRLVNTIHNLRPHRYSGVMPRRVEDAISNWMLRQCDGLLVHTEELRRGAIELLGPRHPPIFVTPHGVFRPAAASNPPPLRERLRWKKALLFGTVRRSKGPHTAMAAMKRLDGFQLTIAGHRHEAAHWRQTIEPLLAELRAAGKTINVINEYISDEAAAELFAQHSFALLPYTNEFHSQSGVLHLAIGLETPVVATTVGGIGETIKKWDVGETASPESPEELAAAITRLYARDPDALAAKLRGAAEGLSWDETARRTVEAYRTICSSSPDSGTVPSQA